MSAENVSKVLLRVLTDGDFHNAVLRDPGSALDEYDLTEEERASLIHPDASIFRYLTPTPAPAVAAPRDYTPPTTTVVTVTVASVVTVLAFATAPTSQQLSPGDAARLAPLIDAIKRSSGAERVEHIARLIQALNAQ